jgi:DNA (cytosine-5)-methyltransferase 1
VLGLDRLPPCPTFSAAGGGAGRHLTEIIVACLRALSEGRDTRAEARAEAFETLQPVAWEAEQAKAKKAGREPSRERADARARRDADMSILVVEPLRWALALRPEWVALEQVPEVLPLWEVMASLLQAHGYSAWTGKLEAERFGVPQTRERAILIAHRSRAVVPPEPTHQRYVPGEPQRHEVTMFGEVLPWVSMAEALGWERSSSRSGLTTRGRARARSSSSRSGTRSRRCSPAPCSRR